MLTYIKNKWRRFINKVFKVPEKGDLVRGVFLNPEQIYLVLCTQPTENNHLNLELMNLKTNAVYWFGWTEEIQVVSKPEDL
jgi:hypothetical protein